MQFFAENSFSAKLCSFSELSQDKGYYLGKTSRRTVLYGTAGEFLRSIFWEKLGNGVDIALDFVLST